MARKRSELPESIQKFVRPKAGLGEVVQAEALYEAGMRDGNIMAYGEILSKLEQKYMGEERPKRGEPEAIAILELAKEIGNELRTKIEKLNAE